MECIAASQRPSERVLGFYSGNLICIYCTVAIKKDVYRQELLQVVLELTHGQINQRTVPKLVNVLVVWWVWVFFPPFRSVQPSRSIAVHSPGWEGPRKVITAAWVGAQGHGSVSSARLLNIPCPLHASHEENEQDKEVSWSCNENSTSKELAVGFLAFLKMLFWFQICLLRLVELWYPVTFTDKDVLNTHQTGVGVFKPTPFSAGIPESRAEEGRFPSSWLRTPRRAARSP